MITEKDINTAFENEFDGQEKSLLVQEILKGRAELERHRWIPVGERLPDDMGDYLVSNGIWIERIWFDNGWCYQKGAEFQDKSKVTHWKPIHLPNKGK